MALSVFLAIGFGVLSLILLKYFPGSPYQVRMELAFVQFLFFIPTTLAWFASRRGGAIPFTVFSSFFAFLISWGAASGSFLVFVVGQGFLYWILDSMDRVKESEIISNQVEIEEQVNERNDLEVSYKEKGTSISVSFEKYASYYNLRNIALEFSTSLSLGTVSQMIVSRTMELIQKGDWCLLFLADSQSENLLLVASKSSLGDQRMKAKSGEIFDYWVLKNKQSLIVSDAVEDFRFDAKKVSDMSGVRSLIAAPLMYEGKVIGTLRSNSSERNAFDTDDLRLLDAVAMLASAAISNSLLYQKTEELAIRDSLTGLFVQRYFLERLAEEHKRCLLAKTPLTLFMCDLDFFKACNDRYGHAVGDLVLSKTAEVIKQIAGDGIVARYGGEEFVVLLPKVDLIVGRAMAESLRVKIKEMNLTVRREIIPMTISIGVASIPEDTLDIEQLIRLADERLYVAKKQGRDRVC